MLFKNIFNKMTGIKDLKDELKIIYLYRYFSLTLTSLFYLLGNLRSPLKNKLIVIACLTTASILLNNLYIKNEDTKKIITILVSIEILGNSLILIPTGGLNSPYIWYALNTIFITMNLLDAYFCWINLSVYLVFFTLLSVLIFNKGNENFLQIILDNSNLILSLILITAAAQLLLELTKKLKNESRNLAITNTQLSVSNERIKESMENMMSLYNVIQSFANMNRKEKLTAVIIDYTTKITKSNFVFLGIKLNQEEWFLDNSKKDELSNLMLLKEIKSKWNIIKKIYHPLNMTINNINYAVIAIKSAHMNYGILGIENYDNPDQIRFISNLSSMAFEKFRLEEINSHLLISEEQNRIANEIHDSVSQRLFSISCCIHGLIMQKDKITKEDLSEKLEVIKASLNKAMKDLRKAIYGLSWGKSREDMFISDIKNYLNEVSDLNETDISFNVTGNEELLSCDLKKAIYRIICEGTGNAIRHGKCRKIEISLDIKNELTWLSITDNGTGFCYNKMSSNGLGIKNMVNLASCFDGQINVNSQIGQGTTIDILFNKKNA